MYGPGSVGRVLRRQQGCCKERVFLRVASNTDEQTYAISRDARGGCQLYESRSLNQNSMYRSI